MKKFEIMKKLERVYPALLSICLVICAVACTEEKQEKPNVLMIMVDQQSYWTLSIMGENRFETPNIDRIGHEGAMFNNFFSNCAICTPSRGCFQSGKYPYSNGAVQNGIPLRKDVKTLGHVFSEAGYQTGFIGKWHLAGKKPKSNIGGFLTEEDCAGYMDYRFMFNMWHGKKITGGSENAKLESSFYVDDNREKYTKQLDVEKSMGDEISFPSNWFTGRTAEFIEKHKDEPFFLSLNHTEPHNPFYARPPYDQMFSPDEMLIPDNFIQKDLPQWAVAFQERARHGYQYNRTEWPIDGVTDREVYLRRLMSQWLGSIKHLDDCIGATLKTLEDNGVLDNTIIIYTTDHGDYMGRHGLSGKPAMYEDPFHLPLLVRYPKKIKAGTVVNKVASSVDFLPTVCALAGVEYPADVEGKDASVLITRKKVKADWQNVSFQYFPANPNVKPYSPQYLGIFTEEWHLVLGSKKVENVCCLFDRKDDRYEMSNLYNDPDYKAIIDELTTKIVKHAKKVNLPETKWLSAYE